MRARRWDLRPGLSISFVSESHGKAIFDSSRVRAIWQLGAKVSYPREQQRDKAVTKVIQDAFDGGKSRSYLTFVGALINSVLNGPTAIPRRIQASCLETYYGDDR